MRFGDFVINVAGPTKKGECWKAGQRAAQVLNHLIARCSAKETRCLSSSAKPFGRGLFFENRPERRVCLCCSRQTAKAQVEVISWVEPLRKIEAQGLSMRGLQVCS
jgi:hypothetical protein